MGRSPVLPTVSLRVARPTLMSMWPDSQNISPGIMDYASRCSGNRMVHGDEFRAVGESGFDLHFRDHLRNAVHDVVAREDGGAEAHEFGHRAAVARALEDGGGDQRHGFRVVELEAARLAAFRHQRRGEEE